MTELDISSFVIWSIVTGIVIGVTGLSYRVYLRRKKSEIPPP